MLLLSSVFALIGLVDAASGANTNGSIIASLSHSDVQQSFSISNRPASSIAQSSIISELSSSSFPATNAASTRFIASSGSPSYSLSRSSSFPSPSPSTRYTIPIASFSPSISSDGDFSRASSRPSSRSDARSSQPQSSPSKPDSSSVIKPSRTHYTCDGTCRYSFTAAIVSHPSLSSLSTQVVTTTAYELPITYRLPNGQLLSTTSTYGNYHANSTLGYGIFATPAFVQPTFTYKSYTLTAPTTYYVIPTGGIYGYPNWEQVDERCDKVRETFELNLAPVPSLLDSIRAEQASAFSFLTAEADPEYCTTWKAELTLSAFPTFPLLLLPKPSRTQSPLPLEVTATNAAATTQVMAPAAVIYTSASVVTKVLPGQISDVAKPPPGFAIEGDPASKPVDENNNPGQGQQQEQPGQSQPGQSQDGSGQGAGQGQGQANKDDNLVQNIVGALTGAQNSGQGQGQTGSMPGQQGGQAQEPNNLPQNVPNPVGPIAIGGQLATPIGHDGGVVIGSQTFGPGATGAVGGTQISIGSNGNQVVVGGQTVNIPGGAAAAPTPVSLGGLAITPIAGGAVMIGSQTVQAGSSATLAGGDIVSVGPGGLVSVNGQVTTIGGSGFGQGSPITVNGAGITPLAGGAVIIDGSTIQAGGAITLSNGQVVSVAPGGSVVVVNGASGTLPMIQATPNPNAITVDNAQITPLTNGAIVVAGTTIMPGNAITLGNGQIISLASGGSAVVINGQTQAITLPPSLIRGTPVTINGVVVTPIISSAVVVDGQTVYAGARSTLANGQVISVDNSGSQVVVNGVTGSITPVTAIIPIVLGGETITPAPNGQVIFSGRTFSAGQAVTLSNGKVISVGTSGTVVIDGTTTKLPFVSSGSTSLARNSTTTTSKQTTRNPGEAIASGIGATKAASANMLLLGDGLDMTLGSGLFFALIGLLAGL